jgi:hypothetical protein
MSNTDQPEKDDRIEEVSNASLSNPKSKTMMMLQEMEFMAMQKKGDGLDFSKLTPAQTDRVLGIMEKNEDNGFAYHSKRLEQDTKIEIEKIKASVINHKTNRFTIISIIFGIILITILILCLKDNYLPMWLSFVAGIGGGFGLGKGTNKNKVDTKKKKL